MLGCGLPTYSLRFYHTTTHYSVPQSLLLGLVGSKRLYGVPAIRVLFLEPIS
jgi:hypothetical protein